MKALMIVSLLLVSPFALAKDDGSSVPECVAISKACEGAGYMPGEHKKDGKGLWVDCIGAIAHGKSVTGVSNSREEAKTCLKAHHAAKGKK